MRWSGCTTCRGWSRWCSTRSTCVCGVAIYYSLMIALAATSVWLGRNQTLFDFWFYLTNFSRYPMEIYHGPWGTPLRRLFTFCIPVLVAVNVPARILVRPVVPQSRGGLVPARLRPRGRGGQSAGVAVGVSAGDRRSYRSAKQLREPCYETRLQFQRLPELFDRGNHRPDRGPGLRGAGTAGRRAPRLAGRTAGGAEAGDPPVPGRSTVWRSPTSTLL